jgi:hypothetical protein
MNSPLINRLLGDTGKKRVAAAHANVDRIQAHIKDIQEKLYARRQEARQEEQAAAEALLDGREKAIGSEALGTMIAGLESDLRVAQAALNLATTKLNETTAEVRSEHHEQAVASYRETIRKLNKAYGELVELSETAAGHARAACETHERPFANPQTVEYQHVILAVTREGLEAWRAAMVRFEFLEG